MNEFNLSNELEVLMDFEAMIPTKVFPRSGEGFGTFISTKKVKEFIKELKKMFPFVEDENKVPLTAKGTNRRNKYWCKRIGKLAGDKLT